MIEATLRSGFWPTRAALRLLLFVTVLNLLGLAAHPLLVLSGLLDLVWLLAVAWDARGARASRVMGERPLPEVLLAHTPNRISLSFFNPMPRPLHGVWLDTPPAGAEAPRQRQSFLLPAQTGRAVEYALPCPPRGRLAFGDVHLELEGPWGLAACGATLAAAGVVRSLPALSEGDPSDLRSVVQREPGRVRLRRLLEGREFDALREYRPGDDRRLIDWKASAKRGEPIVREYAPERNQSVLLLIDCGRHLVASEHGRTKLDYALDAALRLARACLARGDAVGMLAFGAEVRGWVSPAKGASQLKALIDASFDLRPELEESDYRAAFDRVQQRTPRRALICIFSELADEEASRALLARAAALRPKHLPVLVALEDRELTQLIQTPPVDLESAYARAAALRLDLERKKTSSRLRGAGVTLVRAPADRLSLAALDAYLGIKARGLL